jgi:muconolactone delta-isomerase
MDTFMVVATFKPDTSMDEVFAVVAEEQAKVAELHAAGRLGQIHLATASRQTVFLEVFASNVDDADACVRLLPMSKWWDLDIFPLNEAANPQGAS